MKKSILLIMPLILVIVFSAAAEARTITIANIDIDSLAIVELYVSGSGSDEWGDDLLGNGHIPKNDDIDIEVSSSAFDILVVWEDGAQDTYEELGNVAQNSMLLLGKGNILRGPH
jgi:hypothetical protein